MLLPPDLRDWVAADDPVHFVLEVIKALPAAPFAVNVRGSGSEQYPPSMMLALLVYCYSMGLFSSRKIEQATYRDIGVRYLTGDTHPDHDTVCAFRRNNKAAIEACFVRLLVYAKELGLAKVGTVSVDGTHLKANAAKDRNITHERALALLQTLEERVAELLAKAEAADAQDEDERLPQELADRQRLRDKVQEAKERIEARAKEHADKMKETPVKERRGRNDKRHPKDDAPAPTDRDNLSDPDSRLMRKNQHSGYQQAYNAQAVVDAEGSQLILAARISQSSNDGCELAANIDAIPQALGGPVNVLADSGYASEIEVKQLEARGITPYISIHHDGHSKYRLSTPPSGADNHEKPLSKKAASPFGQRLRAKLSTPEGKALYALRKQSVEPVFGIIKKAMGFTQFHLRGLANVQLEWTLVTLAYNFKRLGNLKAALDAANSNNTALQAA
jgi:transposase